MLPREVVSSVQLRGKRLAVGKKNLLVLQAEVYEDFSSYELLPGQCLMIANSDPRKKKKNSTSLFSFACDHSVQLLFLSSKVI